MQAIRSPDRSPPVAADRAASVIAGVGGRREERARGRILRCLAEQVEAAVQRVARVRSERALAAAVNAAVAVGEPGARGRALWLRAVCDVCLRSAVGRAR